MKEGTPQDGARIRESAPQQAALIIAKKPITAEGSEMTVNEAKPSLGEESKFLSRIHTDACNTFSTVLGPETNETALAI